MSNSLKRGVINASIIIFFIVVIGLIISKSGSSGSRSSSSGSRSSSSSSCTSYGAKSFAKKRINSTIGRTQFLDLHSDKGSKWLFYGSAYSSNYNRSVTVYVLVSCSNGDYYVEDVDVQL